jgi:SAM-dependent methyltransferase
MRTYQQLPKKIKCPVCYAEDARILWVADSNQAAQHYVLKEKFPERFLELASHIKILWGGDTCEIVQCKNCEYCYSNPFIAGDERFYTLAYDRSSYPKWKWEFQVTLDVLKRNAGADTSLFEIGAGDGAFVKRVAENILPKGNILCTEFSEYGRLSIEEFGIKCISEDFRNLSSAELNESLDVVCMFQVLEHMDRLDVLFQKLNWLMKNGGRLFIAVPNAGRIEFNELNGALLDMPPNHVGRWNKKCFEILGKRNGFLIEDYQIEEAGFISLAKEFIFYRLLQHAQKSGSFENRLLKVKNRYLSRIMLMVCFAVNAAMAIPALAKKDSRQGGSQWIYFVKAHGPSPEN